MLTSEHTAREIEQKARKVMGILKRGIKFTPTQADLMAIFEKLRKNRLKNLFNIIITWCQHHVDKGGQGENGGSDQLYFGSKNFDKQSIDIGEK